MANWQIKSEIYLSETPFDVSQMPFHFVQTPLFSNLDADFLKKLGVFSKNIGDLLQEIADKIHSKIQLFTAFRRTKLPNPYWNIITIM